MKQVFTLEYEEEPGYVLADLKPVEVDLLKRVIGVCREAKESGNHPFGCLIADRDGKIIMEQGNAEHDLHGDCTAHAETQLIRRATQIYSKEEMSQFTFYNCGDPCAMCAGAIYWSGIKRMLYIGRESELKRYTGDDPRNPTLDLPSRVVFARGQKKIEVLGPFLELESEFMKLHEGFWHPSTNLF